MRTELNIDKALAALADQPKPDWLVHWQQQGQQVLSQTAWPTRKTENWKYTSLKSLQGISWQAETPDAVADGIRFVDWQEISIDFVNGRLVNTPKLPDGVTLHRLSDCSEAEGLTFLQKVDSERAGFEFDALNQSLLTEGYWLKVAKDIQVAQPIHLNFISSGADVVTSTQVLVELESGARATIAETFSATAEARVLVNANTALYVGDNAQLTHYHLLLEEGEVRHIGRVTGSLSRFASLSSFHMAVGGILKRKDITIRHRGEGAELSLNGVYLPKGHEVIDYHTTLEHEVPNCTSSEIFRGIMADHGKAVFNGRIHIHKDAQKSVAEMNNRNLLLSDHAEIDTKPELEIYADDVRCAHGATIAQLDKSLLFYFQARGISKKEAEVMLSFGFINELLDALNDQPVQTLLRPLLATLFAQKQADLARHIL
ncbi:Fe-S cluster assembly protein SufD [Reinekea sp. G2M2-21]|uniref:Fe-S cluster assembly protein SufD n=1 Tax=Reinekea sp. G2M2-21 TaxID=2788942 RepID=UPI0018AB68F3